LQNAFEHLIEAQGRDKQVGSGLDAGVKNSAFGPSERYSSQPGHWRYSSAWTYAGQEGLIEVMRVW
jgi:hypothetical protein